VFENSSQPLTQHQTDAISVAVAPPAPLSPSAQAVEQATTLVGTAVASSTPVITSFAENAYKTSESLRDAGAQYFDAVTANEATSTRLKASSTRATSPLRVFTAARNLVTKSADTIFHSPALFYPIFACIFFGLLYWGIRSVRRSD
jgi:hypothetical protein